MPILNDMHSIVVSAGSANFTAHTYTEIYASASASPVINGVSISMAAGSSIKIKIRNISNATNCFLLGETIDNSIDGPMLGQ